MAALDITAVRKGILKGSINTEKLSNTLKDLRLFAYSYLYNLQKDMVNLFKLQVRYEDFSDKQDNIFTGIYLNSYKEYNVKIPFIHYNHRLKFRRSDFYNKPITNKQAENNRDLFVYSYFVFIDGIMDRSARIKCREELTSICLRKEAMSAELQEHFVPGCKIDILFIPDVRSETFSATKLDIAVAGYKFDTSSTLKPDDHIVVLVSKGKYIPKMFDTTINEDGHVILPEVIGDGYEDTDILDIVAYIIPNFFESKDLPEGTEFFEPKNWMPMPIPTENILYMQKNPDGSLRLDAGITTDQKYPNVFDIHGNEGDCLAHIFYWTNIANRDMKYETEDIRYHSIISILEGYVNGTINEHLSSFIPYLYSYDVPNFHSTGYTDKENQPMLYKANKLFEAYKLWAYASQLYHEKMCEETNSYLIYTEKLDMESKIRTNNHEELSDKTDWVEFDEECYIFTFVNKSLNRQLPYKFWIDGLRIVPEKVYLDGKYQYVYIEKSKFKEGSVIEIERSNDITFQTLVSTTPGGHSVDLSELKGKIPFRGLYITDMNGVYVDRSTISFKVQLDKTGTWYDVPDDSTMLIDKDTVMQVYSTEPVNIIIRATERPIQFNRTFDLTNWSDKNLNTKGLIRNIPKYDSRIRVFSKGRLLPPEDIVIGWKEDSNDAIDLQFDYPGYGVIGEFQVDYIPEGYNRIYLNPEINDKGLVDLTGIINKPFSMKYYDVYLNGYRLFPHQIKRVSNFIIQIKEVQTLRRLAIYEKDCVIDDLYVLDADDEKQFLADQLYQNDEEFREKLKEHIETIIPDKTISDIEILDEILEFVVNSVIDYLEIHRLFASDSIEDEFFKKFRPFFEDDVFFINANILYNYGYKTDPDRVYFLAPQKKTEIMGINSPSYVKQFALLMEELGMGYINANTERGDIPEKYPKIRLRDNDDEVLLISGSKSAERFRNDSELLRN